MMRTVIRDWPSGAILLIGKGDLLKRIAVSELKGAPPIGENDKDKVDTLVLDGQQRLTSVYQALTDSSPDFVYYVDMKELHDRDGFEDECLAWAKRSDFPEPGEAAKKLWARLDILFSEKLFSEWLDTVEPKLKDRMEQLYETHLWPNQGIQVSVPDDPCNPRVPGACPHIRQAEPPWRAPRHLRLTGRPPASGGVQAPHPSREGSRAVRRDRKHKHGQGNRNPETDRPQRNPSPAQEEG